MRRWGCLGYGCSRGIDDRLPVEGVHVFRKGATVPKMGKSATVRICLPPCWNCRCCPGLRPYVCGRHRCWLGKVSSVAPSSGQETPCGFLRRPLSRTSGWHAVGLGSFLPVASTGDGLRRSFSRKSSSQRPRLRAQHSLTCGTLLILGRNSSEGVPPGAVRVLETPGGKTFHPFSEGRLLGSGHRLAARSVDLMILGPCSGRYRVGSEMPVRLPSFPRRDSR